MKSRTVALMRRGINWWLGAGSDRRPAGYESAALTTELPSLVCGPILEFGHDRHSGDLRDVRSHAPVARPRGRDRAAWQRARYRTALLPRGRRRAVPLRRIPRFRRA